MSADQASRRRAQLRRLLPLAELQAQAARARLGAARRAEADALSAVDALDRQRRETLARLDRSAPVDEGHRLVLAAQSGRWLRWYAAERRERLTELARLKAEGAETARTTGRAIARHEILRELEQRTSRTLARARARRADE